VGVENGSQRVDGRLEAPCLGGRRHEEVLEHGSLEWRPEDIHATDGRDAEGFAVERLLKRHEMLALGLPRLSPILKRDLQGDFDRGRTIVAIEHVLEAVRGDGAKTLGQLAGGLVRHARQG